MSYQGLKIDFNGLDKWDINEKGREILQKLYFSEFSRRVLASFLSFRDVEACTRTIDVWLSTREYSGNFLWCDGPDTKCIVSKTSEQGLSISRPSNGNTFRLSSFFAHISVSRLELIDYGPRKSMGTKPDGTERKLTYLLSRSKIFTQLAVAAHNQYRFGEKTRALTMSPASREYRCLPSFKSQSMVIPSLPPEAASEPSGETEIVLM